MWIRSSQFLLGKASCLFVLVLYHAKLGCLGPCSRIGKQTLPVPDERTGLIFEPWYGG